MVVSQTYFLTAATLKPGMVERRIDGKRRNGEISPQILKMGDIKQGRENNHRSEYLLEITSYIMTDKFKEQENINSSV